MGASDYTLNVIFNSDEMQPIKEGGTKVVITKGAAESLMSTVAWAKLDIFPNMTISWTDAYALYASDASSSGGVSIKRMTVKDSSPGVLYEFKDGLILNPVAKSNLGSETYAIKNLYEGEAGLTFGLSQKVDLQEGDGELKPINAVYVPYNETAEITPSKMLGIYLCKEDNSGGAITRVTSDILVVTYSKAGESISVKYNPAAGRFYRL